MPNLPIPPFAIALWLLLPLALAWQCSDMAILPTFGWRLDPVLVLVLLAGIRLGPRHGVMFGLVAGAGQDMLVGAGLLYGLTKALVGFAAGLMQESVYDLDAPTLALMGLLGTLGEALLVAINLVAAGRTGVFELYGALALPMGVANAALIVFLNLWLRHLPTHLVRE